MRHPLNQVRSIRARSKSDVQGQLAIGWARCTAGRKGAFADAADTSLATVDRALTSKTLPELHTALNSLAADPTALDEVLALYGVKLAPLVATQGNDLATLADVSRLIGQWADALTDGRRDHRETLSLADAIRPLMPALTAIVVEADQIKTVG